MASAPTTWTDDDTTRDLGPRIVALHAGAALAGEDEFKVCNWVLWAAHKSGIDVTVIERSDILFRTGVEPVEPPAALKVAWKEDELDLGALILAQMFGGYEPPDDCDGWHPLLTKFYHRFKGKRWDAFGNGKVPGGRPKGGGCKAKPAAKKKPAAAKKPSSSDEKKAASAAKKAAVVPPDPERAPTTTTSKYWGVSWRKGDLLWQARYTDANGKLRHIGLFDTQEAAAHAVNAAIRRAGLERKRRMNPVVDGQLVPRARKAPKKRRREEPADDSDY